MAASAWACTVNAQMNPFSMPNIAGMKIAEPEPERPGDRTLSCTQIANEMGEIMSRRGMKSKMASSKSQICNSRKSLDAQGEERKKLLTAQVPELTAAAALGGPVAAAVTRKTQTQEAALEAKQQPERQRAIAGIDSGIGDLMSVMNDPRIMRLTLLAEEHQCAASMAPPKTEQHAAAKDPCDETTEESATSSLTTSPVSPRVATPAGAVDPFVKKGRPPVAQDPFAKH